MAELAHREVDATYWNLEANVSPFYGWGDTGRIETTALAITALSALPNAADADVQDQISRGVQFLLAHKDRYHVWYSTHASEAAVEALAAAIPAGGTKASASKADVIVNGRKATTIDLPSSAEIVGAVAVDLTGRLESGLNVVQVARPHNDSPLNAQTVTSYYIAWKNSSATHDENVERGDTRALRLKVHYDRTTAKIGDSVQCDVQVERIGFAGYGMMLAEIGLPPGADVDRASLQKSGERYEVRPDRVVFYVWPGAGGTKFSFAFRARYRMNASASPSLLYDYYNPEATSVVAPVHLVVR